MATHSSILAWKMSWTEEPCGLQSMGLQKVGHNCATDTYTRFVVAFLPRSKCLLISSHDGHKFSHNLGGIS